MKGMVPMVVFNNIKAHLKSTESAYCVTLTFLKSFIKQARKVVWNYRCDQVIEWEKRVGISVRSKRSWNNTCIRKDHIRKTMTLH
jgi:hypothetical protein